MTTYTATHLDHPPSAVPPRQLPWETVHLLDVPLAAATQEQVIRYMLEESDDPAGRGGGWIITANLDILRRLRRSDEFRDLSRKADFIVADGMPLVWASRLQGAPLPQRVAGSTMVEALAGAAADHGKSIYLLGGNPGAADAAARILQARHPQLTIAGIDCPPMGFEHDEAEMTRIRTAIADAAPDIVYVALGSPKQERLIVQIRDVAPRAWWIGVGISLSFLSGEVRRAPRWVQDAGLEWAHRLAQEPRRLAHRYLVAGVPFAVGLFVLAAFTRFCGSKPDTY